MALSATRFISMCESISFYSSMSNIFKISYKTTIYATKFPGATIRKKTRSNPAPLPVSKTKFHKFVEQIIQFWTNKKSFFGQFVWNFCFIASQNVRKWHHLFEILVFLRYISRTITDEQVDPKAKFKNIAVSHTI